MDALITQIQRFSVHDGPGIRTTVFMKGCNLRCLWCHNPETLKPSEQMQHFASKCAGCGKCAEACGHGATVVKDGVYSRDLSKCVGCFECEKVCVNMALSLCGKRYSVDELCEILLKDRKYYIKSGGGVTFSGGEALLRPEYVFECADRLRSVGINCAIETAANVPEEVIRESVKHFDIFMCDIKAMDSELHRRITGVPNERILSNLRVLATLSDRILIRIPVAMTLNGTDENIAATAEFMKSAGLKNIELLKLHRLAEHKYDSLSMEYTHPDIPETTDADIERLYKLFDESFVCGMKGI